MIDFQEPASPPDFRLGGCRIWIKGRTHPHSKDLWDGNWLNVIATCEAPGAHVQAAGDFIHLSELVNFQAALEKVYQELGGTAELRCMEPELRIVLDVKETGLVEMRVMITPDHLHQSHQFNFGIDQSFLPPAIRQLVVLLERFPMVGAA